MNPALAPAYDFVSTVSYIPGDQFALNVSRRRAFGDFSEDELSHLAAKAALPSRVVIDTARETVDLFHEHWSQEKSHLPMRADVRDAIERHLKTVPIA